MKRIPTLLRIAGKGAGTGFSLVEVTLALGIVSFCLLAVIGLLPVGLKSVKTSREETGAANAMEQIANAIRGAVPVTATSSRALGPYSNLVWTIGSTTQIAQSYTNISLGGIPTSYASDQQLVAQVQITPPASAISPGSARISVAWPSRATWNSTTTNWNNAQGSLAMWLIFLPAK